LNPARRHVLADYDRRQAPLSDAELADFCDTMHKFLEEDRVFSKEGNVDTDLLTVELTQHALRLAAARIRGGGIPEHN
jgi:hypothetical protein